MRVSCIIPTKNRKQMALRAVGSVLEQQGEKPEVILVDDGSSDATAACLMETFPEINIITTAGLGPGGARNAGVAASSGDIVMFLDSDDLWMPHHVKALHQVIAKGFPVAYGVAATIDEINGGEFTIPDLTERYEGDCFRHLLRWCFLVPSATAVKREAFEAVSGFGSEPFGEDWIFFLRLAALFPFGFAAEPPITLRRLHQGCLCHLKDTSKILQLIRHIIKTLEEEPRVIFADIAHFMRLEQFVIQRGQHWATAQDWYQAMRAEGII
jgi:glycosyltransferase involved in cell wall biosynthesis